MTRTRSKKIFVIEVRRAVARHEKKFQKIHDPTLSRISVRQEQRAGRVAHFPIEAEPRHQVSTHLENELAPEVARLAHAMRVCGLRQTIELDLGSAHGPDLEQLGDALEMPARASDRRPQRAHVATIGGGRLGARRDEGGAAARLEHREGLLGDVAADGIEDGVTTTHRLREIGGVVVDDLVGPEAAHIGLIGRARGGDHVGAEMLGELNGKARDATRPALDQDFLSAFELQRILDGAQRRQPGEREGGGVDMRQPLRLLGDDGGLDRDLLGIGALLARLADAEDRVSHLEISDAFADGADHAGKIPPQSERKLRLLVLADAHLPVRAVDAGGDHIDDHLARPGNGIRQVAILQDLRPAILLNESCFHRAPPDACAAASLTSILPKFLPCSRPRNAAGACSSPSTMSSLYVMLPLPTLSPISRRKSACFAAKSETMNPRRRRRLRRTDNMSGPGMGVVMLYCAISPQTGMRAKSLSSGQTVCCTLPPTFSK